MQTAFSRRAFLKNTTLSTAGTFLLPAFAKRSAVAKKRITIQAVNANFEREPLRRPFGFKGSAMTEVWQVVAALESDSGIKKVGLGTQNVLWSDAQVFANHSENGGNALMFAMTEYALQQAKGKTFTDPIQLLDDLLEDVLAYGQKITGNPKLRKTFALNALVPVDNAAWLLFAEANGFHTFDEMLPTAYRPALSYRHDKVASIPALGYGTPIEEIKSMADDDFFIMKIKIGAPGTQAEMLEKDKAFLKAIHDAIGHYETPYTDNGKIPYYFDANGRYEKQETLWQFLEYAEKIGALEQIAVVEEPFGEHNEDDVSDFPVIVAADESAHTDEDTVRRIEQGYSAIAVKAIAKTLSMTLKMVKEAHERNISCFCADLTVNPILVDWNKSVAARLAPFPGMDKSLGLQETNGHQNYKNWRQMLSYHPTPDAPWVQTRKGVYQTGKPFFRQSGGIFQPSAHYTALIE